MPFGVYHYLDMALNASVITNQFTRGCVASTLCKGELLVFIRLLGGGGGVSVSLFLVCLDRLFNWNSCYGWYLPGLNL